MCKCRDGVDIVIIQFSENGKCNLIFHEEFEIESSWNLIKLSQLFNDIRYAVLTNQLKSQLCSRGKRLRGHMALAVMSNGPTAVTGQHAASVRCTSHTETLC